MADPSPAARDLDEFDVPLAGLPQPGWLSLAERGHIDAATAEVRFVARDATVPEPAAAAIWQALGGSGAYPVFEPATMQAVNVTLTPTGATSTTDVVSGWTLRTADGARSVMIFPALLGIHTSKYERYSSDLGQPLAVALAAYRAAMPATLANRIGLRYINRLLNDGIQQASDWRRAVRVPFAGALTDGHLGSLVSGMHQQLDLQLGTSAGARVVSGLFDQSPGRDGPTGFLIDIDVFRDETIPFEVPTLSNLIRQLNRTALALFLQVLTEDAQAELGPSHSEEQAS